MESGSGAELTVVPLVCVPGGGTYWLACAHGVESLEYDPRDVHVSELDVIRTLLLRHYAREGCRCPAGIWRRYGLKLAAHWRNDNLRSCQKAC